MDTIPFISPAAQVRAWRVGLALFSTTLLFGCPPNDTDTKDTHDTEVPTRWSAELEELPGAILSVWGSGADDIWLAGTDPDGDGIGARHYDGSGWQVVDVGVTTDLWWVFGRDDQRWFVGDHGVILRHDTATGNTASLSSGAPDAMLFGAWGSNTGVLYAVGGTPGVGPAVLFEVDGDTVTPVSGLPSGMPATESFFKVWGSSASDVWVIGDQGSVLHFDGSDWSRQVLPERLVTINGAGADDVVVVGGATTGAIFERDGLAWNDVSPSSAGPLNGIFVADDGYAVAAGYNAQVFERTDGIWSSITLAATHHWHGVWIAPGGDALVVGGNLTALTNGAVYRLARE